MNQWESDFRYPAMQASMAIVADEQLDDLSGCQFSFCLPVFSKPVNSWINPGRLSLLFLVLGFGGLICGGLMAFKAEQDLETNFTWVLIALACGVSGIAFLLLPALLQKRINSWFIGDRGKALVAKSRGGDLIYCELGDSSNPKLTIDGDDNVIVLLDKVNERLLIEGVAASYQIRKQDVRSIQNFEFMGCIGADIVYQIGSATTLRLGIASADIKKELTRQIPFLSFIKKDWSRNRILDAVV
ncbi:MAG: hypothetical protein AAF939_22920, partial [Planctomycetota bacterium]